MKTTITVCDKCHRACCWQGNFMCDNADMAGTIELTREDLESLNLENPGYWKID